MDFALQDKYIAWAIYFFITYGSFKLFKSQEGFFKFLAGILLFSVSVALLQTGIRELAIIWLAALLLAYRHKIAKLYLEIVGVLRSWYYEAVNAGTGIYRYMYQVGYLIGRAINSVWTYIYNAYISTYNGVVFLLNKTLVDEEKPRRKTDNRTHNKKNHQKRRNKQNGHSSRKYNPHRRSNRRNKREEELKQEARKAQEELKQAQEEARKAQARARRAEAQAQKSDNQQANSPPPDTRSAYEILGAQSTATASEIKRAYKECCQRFHPDKYATRPEHIQDAMEEELKKVQQAYRTVG